MNSIFSKRAEIEAKRFNNQLASDKDHLLHLMYYNYGS